MAGDVETIGRTERALLAVALTGFALGLAGSGRYLVLGSSIPVLGSRVYGDTMEVTRQCMLAQTSFEEFLAAGRGEDLRQHTDALAAAGKAGVSLHEAYRLLDAPAAADNAVNALTATLQDWEASYCRAATGYRRANTDRDVARLRGLRERGIPAGHAHEIRHRLDSVMSHTVDSCNAMRARLASRQRTALAVTLGGLMLGLGAAAAFAIRYGSYQRFLRRRSTRLEELADYADRMHGLANADQAAKALAAAVGSSTRRSTVLFRIPGNPGMRIAAASGDLPADAGDSPVLADRAACPVMRTGHRFLLRNPATELRCDCQACAPHDGGYVCVPLLAQGGTVGLANWQAGRGRSPQSPDLNRIEELARVTSLALTNLFSLEGAMHDAVTDQLTGVANRRFLDGYLGKQFQISLRQGRPLGVLMLDLDHFKVFNDTNGHLAGDAVLRAASRTATAAVRDGDLVARYGGEEFAVVLPDADRAATLEIAERIRAGVEEMRVDGLPSLRPPVITVSIGAAVAPSDGRTVQAVMRAADEALYAAKELGRNRIVAAPVSPAA